VHLRASPQDALPASKEALPAFVAIKLHVTLPHPVPANWQPCGAFGPGMMGTLTGAPIASKLITYLDAQYVECKVICTFEPLETITVCELLDSEILTNVVA